MEVNPLNIFFVKSDSKGDRLLFRYPYRTHVKHEYKQIKYGHNNPYAVTNNEDLLQNTQTQTSNISKDATNKPKVLPVTGQLSGFTDEMLSTLFAVKAELCNRKFELKVNDVRFVGHPTLLPYRTNKDDSAAMILINIVFALQASASHSIVKCYYDLSKRLGKALRHEEKRCSYLTEEMKIMLAAHDELTVPDADPTNDEDEIDNLRHSVSSTTFSLENGFDNFPKSAFHIILQRSSLARSMKEVFRDLCKSGIVHVQINKWVLLSFCLPHKAHHIHNNGLIIEPETIDKCLRKLRPYHGILLMVNPNELLECIPLDGCPALLRLIKLYSPLKSLQTLAMEAFLTLSQVFQLTGHLVYWAKATVIYPLCEGNVYVVAPGANVDIHSPLVEEFAAEFNGLCLLQVLSAFSLPAPLWYHARGGVGGGADLTRLPRVVAWLLRRRLLLQLHTYVHFISQHWSRDSETKEYYCEKHDIPLNRSNNSSLTSLNQLQLNVPEPVEPRKCLKLHAMNEQDYPTQNNLNQTDFSHTKPIVIESDMNGQYEDVDSANHSFDDNDNEVAALVSGQAQSDLEGKMDESKNHGSSVDSGINGSDTKTTRTLAVISRLEEKSENMDHKDDVKTMTSRLSDVSLKDHGKETSSDEDQFSDTYVSPFNKQSNGLPNQKKKNVPVLRIQTENSNFHSPTMWNGSNNCDGDSFRNIDSTVEENILEAFTVEERLALSDIAYDPEDILLLAQLHKKGYFHGEHHLEEIMFMENVTRSQLMQLLDKFREVLITFETEDLAVAMLYPKH